MYLVTYAVICSHLQKYSNSVKMTTSTGIVEGSPFVLWKLCIFRAEHLTAPTATKLASIMLKHHAVNVAITIPLMNVTPLRQLMQSLRWNRNAWEELGHLS